MDKGADPTVRGLGSGIDAEDLGRVYAEPVESVELVKCCKRTIRKSR